MGEAQLAMALGEVAFEPADHLVGVGIETRAGDSDHLDSVQLQLLLPQAVALEGRVSAVGLVDVEFDRESQLRPVHIEHEAVDGQVRRWGRQAGLPDGGQEATLKPGEGQVSREIDAEGAPQRPDAVMTTGARQERIDRAEIEEAALLGQVEEAFETTRRRGGNIEEGARQRGDRDAVDNGAIGRLEYLGVVNANRQAWPAAHRTSDVERPRAPTGDPPEPSSREVAEQSTGSASKYGRQAVAVDRQLLVTDGVDAGIQTVKAPGGSGSRNRTPGVTERPGQLADRDNAVLKLGHRGKSMVIVLSPQALSSFLPHTDR
jgi:hypothetical protein